MKRIKVISPGDVTVERDRVELSQEGNAVDIRIDAVADRNINQSVFPAKGDSRFCSDFG